MSDLNLNQVAGMIADARRVKKDAEDTIKKLSPVYFKLLDEQYGDGAVVFSYNGWKYGRVVAEKATLNVDKLVNEHPEFFGEFIYPKPGYELREDKLQEYLAEHPEDQTVIQQYVETTLEPRWKNPVVDRGEDG